jgi:hypothetical protein
VKSKLRVVEGGRKHSIFQDLAALQILPDDEDDEDPKEASQHAKAGEVWQDGTFAMVPKLWHCRLSEIGASGDLRSLAWVLLYRANLESRFPVTSREMFEAGVARQHKRKLLERLEAAGLVRVEWRPAPQVPWVTVLHLRRPQPRHPAGRRGRSK